MSNFYDNLNISGNLSINNSSTGNTLYINQLGSGNAVLIEDTTSPDATPFIIDSSGNINVGRIEYLETSSGNKAKLQVNNSTSTIPFSGLPFTTNFIVQGFNQNSVGLFTTDINHSQIYFGTPSDVFGSNIRWDYSNRLLNISTQNTGGTLTLSSGENNEVVRVQSNGYVGIGTNNPIEKLDVSGNTKISGSLNVDFTDSLTYVNNTLLGSPFGFVYIQAFGGFFDIEFSGDSMITQYQDSDVTIYEGVSNGNAELVGLGSIFPLSFAGTRYEINSGDYSGSTLLHAGILADQTALGGSLSRNISLRANFIDNVSGDKSYMGYELGIGTTPYYNVAIKTNNAGESIAMVLNNSTTGFVIGNDISDNTASVLRVEDNNGDAKLEIFNDSIFLGTLPTSSSGLTSGSMFTQTAAQLGGTGNTKVLCIV